MKRPVAYFSFRSPFSWLALERLQLAMPAAFDVLDLVPYWEPDASTAGALALRGAQIRYAPMSKAKHLYILYETRRLATKLGLAIKWPVDVNPHWEIPHLAWLAALGLGKGQQMYCAIASARWLRGEDICDRTTIAAIASSLALPSTVADAVDDTALRDAGVAALSRAYEDDVFGVPYFRVRHDRFWGFDRVPDFLDALRGAGVAIEATVDGPSYDHDLSGGCG